MSEARALRVAQLTTAFPRWEGDGRAPWIMHSARELQRLGLDVRVVTMHGPGTKLHQRMDGADVYRVRYLWPERLETLQDVGGGLPLAWRQGWLSRLKFIPLFVALVWAAIAHGRKVDLIHAHWTLSGLAAWFASFVTRTPFVLTVHGSDIYLATKIPGISRLTGAMLRRCAHVWAASQDMALATAALGLPQNAVDVLPYGVEIDRFFPGEQKEKQLVLFVGALIERKGVHFLLEAFARVAAVHPNAKLAIVGEGPLRPSLEARSRELGLQEAIDFIGPQSRDETAFWMRRASLLVLPSLEEAFGVVLLEALASGTPCVASRTGGIVDVVSSDVGVLVPVADPEAMALAINGLLGDPERLLSMSRSALDHVRMKGHTWPQVALRVESVYRSVLSQPVRKR